MKNGNIPSPYLEERKENLVNEGKEKMKIIINKKVNTKESLNHEDTQTQLTTSSSVMKWLRE